MKYNESLLVNDGNLAIWCIPACATNSATWIAATPRKDACEWVSFCPADKGAGKGKGKKGGRDDGYLAADTRYLHTWTKHEKTWKTHVF